MSRVRRHKWTQLVSLVLLWPAATPHDAIAQPSPPAATLGDLMTGEPAPLTLQLKDLDGDWRKLKLDGADQINDSPGFFDQALGGSLFYTRGQVRMVGSDSFLVCYRLQMERPSLRGVMMGNLQPATMPRLTPDTELALALINLGTAGNLRFVEPVSVDAEIKMWDTNRTALAKQLAAVQMVFEGAPPGDDATLQALSRIGGALAVYADDHDGQLPPMTNATELTKALQPALGEGGSLLQPGTKTPFTWNTMLSGQVKANFVRAGETIVAYEAKPAQGKQRAVLFLDGQVRRVSVDEWKKLKQVSLMR